MASFPGASTQWLSIPARIPGPWTQRNDTEANDIAKDIGDRIENLRTQAEDLAVQASAVVADCAAFTAPPVSINMPMPEYTKGVFVQTTPTTDLVLEDFPDTGLLDGYDFEVAGSSFYFNTHALVPTVTDVELFPLPGASPDIHVPYAAEAADFPLPDIPEFLDLEGTVPPEPQAPKVPTVGYNLAFIDASDIPPIDISTDKLISILNGVVTAAGNVSTSIPDYVPLDYSPDKVSAEHDAYHIARSTGLSATRAGIVHNVWSQRGVECSFSDNAGLYTQKNDALDAVDAANVAEAEAIRYSLADARQDIGLAAALYGQTVEVQASLFGARIAQLEAQTTAQRFLWDAAVMSYRGAVAEVSAGISNNELSNTALGLAASIYKSKLRRHSLIATQNSLRHGIFAAQENAKRIFGVFANTTASSMRAELTRHRVLTSFKAAKLRRLGNEITKFRQDIAVWQAELAKIRASYATYSAEARAGAIKNGLVAAKVQTSNVGLDRIIEANRQLATRTRIAATEAQLNAKDLSTANLQVESINQTNALLSQLAATNYGVTASLNGVADTARRADLTGIAYENEAASKFFIAASEGIHRAATIAQQANVQLATAYNTTQEAAGKAYASIEAGRLSGWNASASLEARGNLTAQTNEQRSVVDAYNLEVSESNSESQSEE